MLLSERLRLNMYADFDTLKDATRALEAPLFEDSRCCSVAHVNSNSTSGAWSLWLTLGPVELSSRRDIVGLV